MQYSIEISKVIEGALKQDKKKVINYTNLLIEKLEDNGDMKTVKKLRRLINSCNDATLSPMDSNYISHIPVDNESRSLLADIIYPDKNDIDIILSKDNENDIRQFIENYKMADVLSEAGIDIANTLLLYGPPGCGKTKSAYYIAKEMNLPLIVARLDSMISSYLGTTAKNIRYLFEFAQRQPCVLFLDEFDALAKARDDANELGELKRVVNSLLQNIDALSNGSIMIAATNHEKLLDPAVWRRFDYKIKIGLPEKEDIERMVNVFLKDIYKFSKRENKQLANIMKGLSGAEIEEIITKELRNSIVHNETIDINNVFIKVLKKKGIIKLINDRDDQKLAIKYLLYNCENFTKLDVANILGISRSTVYSMIREGGDING